MTLNERIAKLKGWTYSDIQSCDVGVRKHPYVKIRDWSGTISHAWELVLEIQKLRPPQIDHFIEELAETLTRMSGPMEPKTVLSALVRHAECAPKAICIAWLAVMEAKDA